MPMPPRTAHPRDRTDGQWAVIAPMTPGSTGWGAPIPVARREVVSAIRYLLSNGCKWSALPHEFPREGTVRDHHHQWRRAGVWRRIHDPSRDQLRHRAGRGPDPSAATLDRRTVKATRTTGTRGDDAGGKITGRKRHIPVDARGLLLAGSVHPADTQDRDGARLLVRRAKVAQRWPRLRVVLADGGYAGRFIGWVREWWQVAVPIIERSDQARGLEVLPTRWAVERTFGWLGDYRRPSKGCEFHPQTSEAMLCLAMTHLMLKRLAPARPPRRVDGIPAPPLNVDHQ